MKPHEEEWEFNEVTRILETPDNDDAKRTPRGRLASAAPNMARALLADMVMGSDGVMHDEFRCPFLSGGECADWCAQKRAALKKAGALP